MHGHMNVKFSEVSLKGNILGHSGNIKDAVINLMTRGPSFDEVGLAYLAFRTMCSVRGIILISWPLSLCQSVTWFKHYVNLTLCFPRNEGLLTV